MNSDQASRNRNQQRFRTAPLETTGDRTIDQAIARYIHNPNTLPCDNQDWTYAWWQGGGHDGIPEPTPWAGFERPARKHSTPREDAYTRSDIIEARQ